jgi:SAM-dependent methyltransferase
MVYAISMHETQPDVFDRALLLARQRRAAAGELIRHVAEEAAERLSLVKRSFARALVMAPHAQAFAERLEATGQFDAIEAVEPKLTSDLGLAPESYEAAFSLLDLHAVNDVPGALIQFRRALKPDGLFMAAFFGGDTLTELREAWIEAEERVRGGISLRVAPMIGVRELGALLQRAGFALPVADIDRITLRYEGPLALMREIKTMGLANAMAERLRVPVSRKLLAAASGIYWRRFKEEDGRVPATIELAWATAWSPHESQQQPLKPGSARARLADALGVKEEKL